MGNVGIYLHKKQFSRFLPFIMCAEKCVNSCKGVENEKKQRKWEVREAKLCDFNQQFIFD